jgi:5-methyltetrahydropteroyltriglutamate--homocysteine methyltransferase
MGQKLFFRADQVGSLLRPPELLQARADFESGRLPLAALRQAEDQAIAKTVKLQEECGFEVVVDGEFRRENWWIDFVRGLKGVEIQEGKVEQAFIAPQDQQGADAGASSCGHDHGHDQDQGWKYVPKNVITTQPISLPQPITVNDYTYLQSVSAQTAKVTIPSPTRLHFHGGRASVSQVAYPDIEAFFDDVTQVYRQEIAALERAGCRYIQIDDPLMTYFISERMRQEVLQAGDDPEARLDQYIALTNACIAERSADTTIGIHVCRGNSKSGWIAEGGYERIAQKVFSGLHVDHFLLEYDDERSGDFEPLRFIPQDVRVVLGLVTTKFGRLEAKDDLKRRIDEASRLVDLERLAISPQCGFASTVEGNIITHDDQWKKLRLVCEVAKEVWA